MGEMNMKRRVVGFCRAAAVLMFFLGVANVYADQHRGVDPLVGMSISDTNEDVWCRQGDPRGELNAGYTISGDGFRLTDS